MRPLEDFPATSLSVTPDDFLDMLLALGGSLQADMASMVTTVSTAVQDLSLRMYPTETKISDTCHAHNDLVDGFSDRDTALYLINAKLADLEDQF